MAEWDGTLPTLLAGEVPDGDKFAILLDVLAALTGPWDSFTPTITASGTAFAAGNSTLVGAYKQVGKFVVAKARVTIGNSGVTVGSGTYNFALPPVAPLAASNSVGSAYFRDASATSTGHFPGISVVDAALSTTVLNCYNVNQSLGAAFPFAVAASDHFSWAIMYEAA